MKKLFCLSAFLAVVFVFTLSVKNTNGALIQSDNSSTLNVAPDVGMPAITFTNLMQNQDAITINKVGTGAIMIKPINVVANFYSMTIKDSNMANQVGYSVEKKPINVMALLNTKEGKLIPVFVKFNPELKVVMMKNTADFTANPGFQILKC